MKVHDIIKYGRKEYFEAEYRVMGWGEKLNPHCYYAYTGTPIRNQQEYDEFLAKATRESIARFPLIPTSNPGAKVSDHYHFIHFEKLPSKETLAKLIKSY